MVNFYVILLIIQLYDWPTDITACNSRNSTTQFAIHLFRYFTGIKMIFNLITFLVLFCVIVHGFGGGWSPVDSGNPQLIDAMNFATKTLFPNLDFDLKILEAKQQVLNYFTRDQFFRLLYKSIVVQ